MQRGLQQVFRQHGAMPGLEAGQYDVWAQLTQQVQVQVVLGQACASSGDDGGTRLGGG
jgi:hypothetical protein